MLKLKALFRITLRMSIPLTETFSVDGAVPRTSRNSARHVHYISSYTVKGEGFRQAVLKKISIADI